MDETPALAAIADADCRTLVATIRETLARGRGRAVLTVDITVGTYLLVIRFTD